MPQFVIKNQEGEYLAHFAINAFGGDAGFEKNIHYAIKFDSLDFAVKITNCHVLHPLILDVEMYGAEEIAMSPEEAYQAGIR